MGFVYILAAGCVIFIVIVGFSSSVSYKSKQRKEKKEEVALEIKHQSAKTKHSALIKKMTLVQKKSIQNANQKILIDWYKQVIEHCKNNAFTRNLDKLIKIREKLKKDGIVVSNLYRFYSAEILNGSSPNTEQIYISIEKRRDKASKSNLFIAKFKNKIDNKLYLVVGVTSKLSLKKTYEDNSVVELIDEIKLVEMNSFDAKQLSIYLVEKFKPDGVFDPFSKFDGYENIIEMRFLKEALSTINKFLKSTQAFDLIENNFDNTYESKDILIKQFEEYGFKNQFSTFADAQLITSDRKIFVEISQIIAFFYKEIYLKYQIKLEEIQQGFESELEEIKNNFQTWKDTEVELMESYIDSRTDLTEKGLTFYANTQPLSVNYKNEVSIVDFPWDSRFEKRDTFSSFGPAVSNELKKYPTMYKEALENEAFFDEFNILTISEQN